MKRNFTMISEIVASSDGLWFDFHNEYLLEDFSYDVGLNVFKMNWEFASDRNKVISMMFKDVLWIRIKGLDAQAPVIENQCLDFMGYLHPDDDLIMDGFLHEDQSSEMHHLIFCFNGGLAIRIFSREAAIVHAVSRTETAGSSAEGLASSPPQ